MSYGGFTHHKVYIYKPFKKVDLYYKSTRKVETPKEQSFLDDINAQLKNPDILNLSSRLCPECSKPFHVLTADGIDIDCCLTCNSTWYDPSELKTLTNREKDVPSDDLKSRKSKYTCPQCRVRMIEYVYNKPDNLLVDRCPSCECVYLENGELVRVFHNPE